MAAILKVKDGNGNVIPIKAIKGEKGDAGDDLMPHVIGDTLTFTYSSEDAQYRVEETKSDVVLFPNTLYVFPEMASLTVAFAYPKNSGIVNEYKFRFTSGETATILTLPDGIIGEIEVKANKTYEVSVVDNYLCYNVWENPQ